MTLTKLAIAPLFLAFAACATQPKWSPSSSNRALGVARVSYEYARSEEPSMSDVQAVEVATNRCAAWGFARAEMIPGELRDCSVRNDGSCDLWKITREYRCSGEGGYARAASR
jgi:Flp pilus assembly protein TadD